MLFNKITDLFQNKIVLYQVGGSVRDELMGRKPVDYDFATPSSPDEVEAIIRSIGRHPHTVGKRFGTVGISIDGQIVEITTFRTETYEPKNRKPNVEFVPNLREDLARRDFTINAMAKDGDGNIIDPFGGRLDILDNRVRCVGKPKDRFKEDPLRILRAVRFASQLNFMIEQNTLGYMEKMASSLLDISKERWIMELDKILESDGAKWGLATMMDAGIFNFILPELFLQNNFDQKSPYHDFDLWTHTLKVVDKVKGLDLRWGALLHDIGKPFVVRLNKKGYCNYIDHEKVGYEMVLKLGTYLKWSNDRRNKVSDIVLNHLKSNSPLYEADNNSKLIVVDKSVSS
jgi:tRNA nucleotidyltransferase (CCA-adding enzyme)